VTPAELERARGGRQSDRGGTSRSPGQACGVSSSGWRIMGLQSAGTSTLGGGGHRVMAGLGNRPRGWIRKRSAFGRRKRRAREVCAFGVRIRRGVSLHGLALNVTTDLRGFELNCSLRTERSRCYVGFQS